VGGDLEQPLPDVWRGLAKGGDDLRAVGLVDERDAVRDTSSGTWPSFSPSSSAASAQKPSTAAAAETEYRQECGCVRDIDERRSTLRVGPQHRLNLEPDPHGHGRFVRVASPGRYGPRARRASGSFGRV
jgi:hypothetical protein